ncbi:hypothetical protein [Pontiella sulfatireligans]|uniref:Uncharacterized protein n=1 Tax=Pontiella sulfatireligans TaxID=2750658 RepID=A0A6C2US22_9BACT|nr:hypothetical protein [Pontiella sulfatireligans]VGO22929.1 hypothetical protein SCARR_05026 [Pontiella sulfatireligans]
MSIQITVPWKIRLRSSESQELESKHWWNRKRCNDSEEGHALSHEDDLDHLGALHKTQHQKR